MPSWRESVSSFFFRSISFSLNELIRYCDKYLTLLEERAFISGVVKMECIHLGMNAFISGPMLSSRDQCSHLGTNALISGPMLSSRDQCSHLGINALISGSKLSSQDQSSHLSINPMLSSS